MTRAKELSGSEVFFSLSLSLSLSPSLSSAVQYEVPVDDIDLGFCGQVICVTVQLCTRTCITV